MRYPIFLKHMQPYRNLYEQSADLFKVVWLLGESAFVVLLCKDFSGEFPKREQSKISGA